MQIKITIITIITSLLGITGCQTTTNSSAIFGPQGREIVSVSYPSGAPKIISDFRTMTGVRGGRRNQIHQGIDIPGKNGQEILAIADGRVLKAIIDKCWGPTIAIDHGISDDGKKIIALYGHVDAMLVSSGHKVKRGQVIACLGNNHFKFDCISRVRHLHLQIGQRYKSNPSKSGWGWGQFLSDGYQSLNPHLLWADGPGKVTCFEPNKKYKSSTITYPFSCR